MHVIDSPGRYKIIIGRDALWELGIELDFKSNSINWGQYKAAMRSAGITLPDRILSLEASKAVADNMSKY
eukprot:3122272-Ditylum_brightwellii.AAC.1